MIADLVASGRSQNAYLDILPDLASVARAHGAAISIGATFRSATVLDADDAAQREEIKFQTELATELRGEGCTVILEGPATPYLRHREIRSANAAGQLSSMPLGPIPTDLAIGQDHVSAAIGATLMGLAGAAHILAAVTREEHTGGVPRLGSTVEALEAARVAAHVIDLHRLGTTPEDRRVVAARAKFRTCVAGRNVPGCSRCGDACPL